MEDAAIPRMVVRPPGPVSRDLLERQEKVLYSGLAKDLAPFVLSRKWGYGVEDVDGNVYLDMLSAMASVPLGAVREEVLRPAVEALARYGNEDAHYFSHEYVLPLAEKLVEITPGGLERVDIALNGTEAVETAVRLMRRATGRPIIIGFLGQYHGESTVTAALGAEAAEIARGVRQLAPGFAHAPYPNPYRSPFGPARPGGSGDATVDYIRDHLLFHALDPGDVAGVMIEPVLGSGGVVVPPDSFWPALVRLCREFGWLLCADEVKTGFGRTGRMFAVEQWGVEPDLMCLGKAIGGGILPLGAVVGTEEVLGSFDDVSTGSTWSWLPGACAAALATIEILQREPVLENVLAIEAAALARLAGLKDRHEVVGDVRAKGCFIAVEFVKDRETKERAPDLQRAVAGECLRRGLLGDSSSTSFNLQPSLVTPVDVVERGLAILDEAIVAVLGK